MTDIAFTCPACRQHLEAPEDMQGEHTACPSCNKTLTVPRKSAERTHIHNTARPLKNNTSSRPSVISPLVISTVVAVLLLGILFIVLRPTPEKRVRKTLNTYLENTIRNNPREAYAVISAADRNAKSEDEYVWDSEDDLFGGILADYMSYKIDSVAIANAEATAYVTIVLPDMEQLMEEFMPAAFAAAFSDDQEIDTLRTRIKTRLESGNVPTVTEKETFHLIAENNEWRMFMDWERLARDAAQRREIQMLLADAKNQHDDGDPQGAIDVYSQILEIDSTSVAADSGIREATREIQSLRDKQEYIRRVELYDFEARHYESRLDRKTPGVSFKLRNTGDRTLTRIRVSVYFRDRNNSIIHEEHYHPVNTSSWSLDASRPLRPNYIWQMERNKFYTAKRVPDEWQEGNAVARITDIEFEE